MNLVADPGFEQQGSVTVSPPWTVWYSNKDFPNIAEPEGFKPSIELGMGDTHTGYNDARLEADSEVSNPPYFAMNIPQASHNAGTRLELWDCNGGANQTFHFVSSTGEIKVYGDSMCLDVSGAPVANGDAVVIEPCNGAANQKWSYDAGTGQIIGIDGLCLDATGFGTADGTLLQVWSCYGTANQSWMEN